MKHWYADHFKKLEQIPDEKKFVIGDLSDGWSGLCKFLGVAKPDEAWPWENKGSSMVAGLLTNNEEYLKKFKDPTLDSGFRTMDCPKLNAWFRSIKYWVRIFQTMSFVVINYLVGWGIRVFSKIYCENSKKLVKR